MRPYIEDRNAAQESHLAPFRPYLSREGVTEVAVNVPGEIRVLGGSGWSCCPAPELDFARLMTFARHVATASAQEIDVYAPVLSAALHSGERVQIVTPPVVPDGTVSVTIRRPPSRAWSLEELRTKGMFDADDMIRFLLAVEARKNILVSGPTGGGKTTLMRAMAPRIPLAERLITIEDVRELHLPHENTVSLVYSRGRKGVADVTARDLLESCLRMRPDRILLAEIRGAEAYDYLQAINSGHPGSITSIHANSARLALKRLRSLVLTSDEGRAMGADGADQYIEDLIDLVIHVEQLPSGKRVVSEIWEPGA